MALIVTILVGLVVGAIARLLMPGEQKMGWILTCLLGIGGSLGAGYIGQALGMYALGQPAGWIASTYSWSAPCGSNRSIRPCATTRSPACASNAERRRSSRNQTHWSWLRSSLRAK